MQYVTIPLGPTHVPANLVIKEMDEPVLVRYIGSIFYYTILTIYHKCLFVCTEERDGGSLWRQ